MFDQGACICVLMESRDGVYLCYGQRIKSFCNSLFFFFFFFFLSSENAYLRGGHVFV